VGVTFIFFIAAYTFPLTGFLRFLVRIIIRGPDPAELSDGSPGSTHGRMRVTPERLNGTH
jgi:hypothetical protein